MCGPWYGRSPPTPPTAPPRSRGGVGHGWRDRGPGTGPWPRPWRPPREGDDDAPAAVGDEEGSPGTAPRSRGAGTARRCGRRRRPRRRFPPPGHAARIPGASLPAAAGHRRPGVPAPGRRPGRSPRRIGSGTASPRRRGKRPAAARTGWPPARGGTRTPPTRSTAGAGPKAAGPATGPAPAPPHRAAGNPARAGRPGPDRRRAPAPPGGGPRGTADRGWCARTGSARCPASEPDRPGPFDRGGCRCRAARRSPRV